IVLSLLSSPPPSISPLSLHDALPIFLDELRRPPREPQQRLQLREAEREELIRLEPALRLVSHDAPPLAPERCDRIEARIENARRSEEHTSELQSHLNLVCRLLLEKKK